MLKFILILATIAFLVCAGGYLYLSMLAPESVIMSLPGIEVPTINMQEGVDIRVRTYKGNRTLLYPDGKEEPFQLTEKEFWQVLRNRSEEAHRRAEAARLPPDIEDEMRRAK